MQSAAAQIRALLKPAHCDPVILWHLRHRTAGGAFNIQISQLVHRWCVTPQRGLHEIVLSQAEMTDEIIVSTHLAEFEPCGGIAHPTGLFVAVDSCVGVLQNHSFTVLIKSSKTSTGFAIPEVVGLHKIDYRLGVTLLYPAALMVCNCHSQQRFVILTGFDRSLGCGERFGVQRVGFRQVNGCPVAVYVARCGVIHSARWNPHQQLS